MDYVNKKKRQKKKKQKAEKKWIRLPIFIGLEILTMIIKTAFNMTTIECRLLLIIVTDCQFIILFRLLTMW